MAAPSWSNIQILAPTKVSAGGTARGTLVVNNKYGAYISIRVGRLTNVAPATGIKVFIRRYLYDGSNSRDIPHPGNLISYQDTTTAANLTTLNGTPTFPGAVVTLTTATGFAGDQLVCIVDSVSAPTRAEWQHTSKISGTTLTLDRNLANTNIVTADTITNQGLTPTPIFVEGGSGGSAAIIEVVFDYGLEANTSPVVVEAWADVLNSVA